MAGETRQKILDATQKLIQLRGLSRVTTKEIARETGLSEGALYRHFEHKEEVFFAIIAGYRRCSDQSQGDYAGCYGLLRKTHSHECLFSG